MVNKISKISFEEMPAVICTAGSYIAKKNSFVEDIYGKWEEGKRLYDSMAPADVLRFDACFAASSRADTLFFPLYTAGRYTEASALFYTVLGYRFAVVFFEKANEFCLCDIIGQMTPEERERICYLNIKNILSVPDQLLYAREKGTVTDIKGATKKIFSNFSQLKRFEDFDFSVTENKEMENTAYMPCDIPLSAYVHTVMQMMFAAVAVSATRKAEIRLCKYNMSAELRVITELEKGLRIGDIDSLTAVYPQIISNISICNYVAGLFKSTITASFNENNNLLSLVFSIGEGEYLDVDFKSRDNLEGFEECFAFSYKYTALLNL